MSVPIAALGRARPPAGGARKIELRRRREGAIRPPSGGRVAALEDVSFEVGAGEFVCLIGPSGCGKSTILNLLAGLDAPDAGEILVDGRPVRPPGPRPRRCCSRSRRCSRGSACAATSSTRSAPRARPRRRSPRRPQRWLAKVGLTDFADAQPHELSAGMRQRVALARALACQPEVLLADEPFGSLDAQSREILQKELQLVWTELGNTFVFVTHNVREAAFLADRVIVLVGPAGTADRRVPDHDAAPPVVRGRARRERRRRHPRPSVGGGGARCARDGSPSRSGLGPPPSSRSCVVWALDRRRGRDDEHPAVAVRRVALPHRRT